MYERIQKEPDLKTVLAKLTPRFLGARKIPGLASEAKYTHEILLENLSMFLDPQALQQLQPLVSSLTSISSSQTTNPDGSPSPPKIDLATVVNVPPASESCSSAHKLQCGEWSACSIMDLKVGFVRHTPTTKKEKVRLLLEKDMGTTSKSHGLRITGLNHARVALPTSEEPTTGGSSAKDTSGPNASGDVNLLDHDNLGGLEGSDDSGEHNERSSHSPQHVDSDASTDDGWNDHATSPLRDTFDVDSPETLPESQLGVAFVSEPPARAIRTHSTRVRDPRQRHHQERMAQRGLITEVIWREGKAFGRGLLGEELPLAIAKFCTLTVTDNFGYAPASPTHRKEFWHSLHPGGGFKPHPHRALVLTYRATLVDLLESFTQHPSVLRTYTFASCSLLFFHQCRFRDSPGMARYNTDSSPPTPPDGVSQRLAMMRTSSTSSLSSQNGSPHLEFRAQVRLVDFSSSGPVASGLFFPEEIVNTSEALRNLVAVFDAVLEKYC